MWLTFSGWKFLSSTICRAALANKYYLNLVLSWNVIFSPCSVIESFAGGSSLGWQLWSLRVCRTSVPALLAFRVSICLHWQTECNSNKSAFVGLCTVSMEISGLARWEGSGKWGESASRKGESSPMPPLLQQAPPQSPRYPALSLAGLGLSKAE